jgi:hypothetical protein
MLGRTARTTRAVRTVGTTSRFSKLRSGIPSLGTIGDVGMVGASALGTYAGFNVAQGALQEFEDFGENIGQSIPLIMLGLAGVGVFILAMR